MAPIINNILDNISDRLDAMSTDTGYNLNWGASNIEDEAKIRWSKSVQCSAYVLTLQEDNIDPSLGGDAFSYRNVVAIEMMVKCPLDKAKGAKLSYELSKRYTLALDDLKQEFKGHDVGVTPAQYYLEYKGMEFVGATTQAQNYQSDRLLPKYMLVRYELEYSQDRADPEQPGDV